MEWSKEAENAVKKVPLFVRKRVRLRVEKEAAQEGKDNITLKEVKKTQNRFLRRKNHDIKGFQVDRCFGSSGCPNGIIDAAGLIERIETLFKKADILGFLKKTVTGGLKFHHEFRVSVADCPNACSQPQIRDIGIIAAVFPELTNEKCSECNACIDICREQAVAMTALEDRPVIDMGRCVACGQCIEVCPTGTLVRGAIGYRVLIGGKLGRHPQLAKELPGIFSEDEVLDIVAECIAIYKKKSTGGARFAEILNDKHYQRLARLGTAGQPVSDRGRER